MGFQPVIDSFEGEAGGYKSSNEEILACATGAELCLRIKGRNPPASHKEDCVAPENSQIVQRRPHEADARLLWLHWRDSTVIEGKDDITSLNLLKPYQSNSTDTYQVIIGRANGALERVEISKTASRVMRFATTGPLGRSTDINRSDDPLLAACVDSNLSLYRALGTSQVESRIPIVESGRQVKAWATRFLSNTRIGVGRGPTYSSICVFDVRPDGLADQPLCNFVSEKKDSVYCLSNSASRGSQDLFLAGWYSGIITMHDLRTPKSVVSTFEDTLDPESAIYSLLPFTENHFVAGSKQHSRLKVFDQRWSTRHSKWADVSYGVFLQGAGLTSSIYSLSSPSPYSPSFYVGLENRIVQMDLWSFEDPKCQPKQYLPFANSLYEPQNQVEVENSSINLGMVNREEDGRLSLFMQMPNISKPDRLDSRAPPGLDKLWISNSRQWHLPHRLSRPHNPRLRRGR